MQKYHNKKVYYKEDRFDSKGELDCYMKLKEDNTISNLRRQVRFNLIPKTDKYRGVDYIADFVYTKDGEEVVADYKGYMTEEFKIKRKLFYYFYHKDIEILR